MSFTGKKKKESSPVTPLKKRRASWSELWLNHHHSLDYPSKLQPLTPPIPKSKTLFLPDLTLLLPDLTLLSIITKVPSPHRKTLSLVCKRWSRLHGGLVRSLKVSDWEFLASGWLVWRFPNLDSVDLVSASFVSPGVLVRGSYQSLSFLEESLLSVETVDRGLRTLASACSSLRKLAVANASELGLLSVAEACPTLQELELHKCSDTVLLGVGAFENLQILRLVVGDVDGLMLVSDIGLMILAQGCKRLVRLELVGCGGGFNGVKEIGECCQMLEELFIKKKKRYDWKDYLSIMLDSLYVVVELHYSLSSPFSFRKSLPSGWQILILSGIITIISEKTILDHKNFWATFPLHFAIGFLCFCLSASPPMTTTNSILGNRVL
ncbi:hypothetical protein F2Q68_00023140 [Brassica cretica]|uniref:F-box domain-containing protein n=1 Tax=Brassica cretica TaxID=69181 RepID=A0A8S9FVW0_BRACR|nr:hypothetical protein F2Q68_00023140 [Brassica cretica]